MAERETERESNITHTTRIQTHTPRAIKDSAMPRRTAARDRNDFPSNSIHTHTQHIIYSHISFTFNRSICVQRTHSLTRKHFYPICLSVCVYWLGILRVPVCVCVSECVSVELASTTDGRHSDDTTHSNCTIAGFRFRTYALLLCSGNGHICFFFRIKI